MKYTQYTQYQVALDVVDGWSVVSCSSRLVLADVLTGF
jgi:hypothetical protein